MNVELAIGIAVLSIVITVVNTYINARFTYYLIRREARYRELRAEGKSYQDAAAEVERTVSFWSA